MHTPAPPSRELRANPSNETICIGPLAVRFLLTGEDSGGSLALFELTVAGGARLMAPAHRHEHFEETIYGLDGVLTWTVDGQQIDLEPQQALCIRRGAVHRFDNHGTADARVLCAVTPAALGPQYFREVAAVANANPSGPPDLAKLVEIMLRHGLTPVAPPAAT